MRSGRRELGVVCGVLVVSAGALWGASALVWYRVVAEVPLRGVVAVGFTGGQVRPALTGVAAVALAAVAAVLAVSGPVRRVVGGLLAAFGLVVAVSAASVPLGPSPFDTDAAEPGFPTPPAGVPVDALRYRPVEVSAAPWLAVGGAVLWAAAGSWVLAREAGLPRLGARFATGSQRRRGPERERAWWDVLDAGEDPTAAPSTGSATDPRPDR